MTNRFAASTSAVALIIFAVAARDALGDSNYPSYLVNFAFAALFGYLALHFAAKENR